jgi:H+/gluconate symporter-like permease
MTEPSAPAPKARQATARQSLRGTVLWVAALAAVAAVLVWSVLWMDLLRQRSDAAATTAATPTTQVTTPDRGQPAQTPAPVTTRSS